MAVTSGGDGEKGHKDDLGAEEDAGLGCGPGHPGGLLEGRGPGPPGAGLPGLALGPDQSAIPGPGPGPEGGHGGHNWEVGALTQPPAPGLGSGETCGQAHSTLLYHCEAYSYRLPAYGHFLPLWCQSEAREGCQALQGAVLPDWGSLQFSSAISDQIAEWQLVTLTVSANHDLPPLPWFC